MADKNTRIAIVNHDKCKPKKCRQECKKSCPVVRMALSIVNLPSNLVKETTHRYCANSFKLHRLPIPRPGEVLGLVGTNGIGKSTALRSSLENRTKPGPNPPDWQEILTYFRGSELQNYFTKILEDDLRAIVKPQSDSPEGENVEDLSGGELQRFACAVVCIQRADIFMFDEPSSYLDVKQRLKAAITIRSLITPDRYIIVVEHDLSINIFLDGYVPTENLRFRETSLVFKVAETANEEEVKRLRHYQYPSMVKTMGDFTLEIRAGEFTDSEIMVMLGENGTGKTTFIRMLAGGLKPDGGGDIPILNVSYKPQTISPKFKGSVRALLHEKIRDAYTHPQFITDCMKPMQIESIIDQDPSAYLDSEQRLMAARVHPPRKKTAFVVEHDFIMATYLADRSSGSAGRMNRFLSLLEITFRRDPNNFRPRINKAHSIKDTSRRRAETTSSWTTNTTSCVTDRSPSSITTNANLKNVVRSARRAARLPIPRPGEVLGLVGTNGIGKSTALKILAGKQKPNLGRFDNPPDWQEILTYFRGSELQNYFTKILEDDLRAIVKPQYVDQIPKTVKRNVEDLSGGELQRFACAVVCIQRADMHQHLSGRLVPTENLRFRETSLVFKVAETANEEEVKRLRHYQTMGDFTLEIRAGEFTDSEIMAGKTTFIRMLAGGLKPDGGGDIPILNVSYKPQTISPKFKGSVRALLHEKIRDAYTHLSSSLTA
ncbi:hypothetical protein F7725_004976 [Dissostichus mawsoni]|uniref:4Fe-4S ferredoxin-type domain-containing protein n=1 Tax=Dissostichus mawsoni TaxID=36200 RepID=A0A7J5XL00_DISMA|nr:hypothetical protein F7725_004976 [Dissostichus mawsoni]